MNYLPLHGQFLLSNGQPLSHALLTHWLKDILQLLASRDHSPVTGLGLVLQLLQHR